ncbi:TetR/AcrR family transcriptional regulator [Actinoplanes sp. NPDC051851]|uniref:TetR/AcrR family transcriptional regulator n=1 Tax=Actinoplanes sp. NPDC051851 TaxID=3154753 RepID=UPI0034406701
MPRTKTGTYAVGRKRRERIIEAAAARFADAGYHRTSLAEIAESVGVTEGGLLYHFPSKKHLLLAVAEHRIASEADWWAQIPEEAGLAGVLDQMVLSAERFLRQPGLIELSVLASAEAADPSSPAHATFAARYERAVDELAGMFRRCVTRGDLPADTDCVALARQSIAVSDGLQLQWVLSDGKIDLIAGIRDHTRRIRSHAAG